MHIHSIAIATALLSSIATSALAGTLKVVTTTTDLGWLAREIGGDRVEVSSIGKGYQDPHYIEPKPSYIVQLAKADALLYNGLELEVGWLPKLLQGAHNPHIQEGRPGLYAPSDRVRILEKPSGAIDRTAGDVHPFGNPHYGLSPDNMAAMARAIAARLALLDPPGAEQYAAAATALIARIEQSDSRWKSQLAAASGMKVITYHKTLVYFLDHFGLVTVNTIEPTPGVPPSSRHLSQLIDSAKHDGVGLLLVENYFEPRHGQFVAERAGIPWAAVPCAVGGEDGLDSWFDLMEHLVAAVARAVPAD